MRTQSLRPVAVSAKYRSWLAECGFDHDQPGLRIEVRNEDAHALISAPVAAPRGGRLRSFLASLLLSGVAFLGMTDEARPDIELLRDAAVQAPADIAASRIEEPWPEASFGEPVKPILPPLPPMADPTTPIRPPTFPPPAHTRPVDVDVDRTAIAVFTTALVILIAIALMRLVLDWRIAKALGAAPAIWLGRWTGSSLSDEEKKMTPMKKPHAGKDKPAEKAEPPMQEPVDQNERIAGFRLFVGGATRKGLVRNENQDAFEVRRISKTCALMVVCDGVGGQPGGREAAGFAARFVADRLADALENGQATNGLAAAAIVDCQQAFDENRVGGLTTAIVAILDGDRLHYATLGDGALTVLFADGMIQDCLAPHHAIDQPKNVITACLGRNRPAAPREGTVRLDPGSLVFAMSDGASELMPMDQIAMNRAAYRRAIRKSGADGVADRLLSSLEDARDAETGAFLHADNMTCAIAALLSDAGRKPEPDKAKAKPSTAVSKPAPADAGTAASAQSERRPVIDDRPASKPEEPGP